MKHLVHGVQGVVQLAAGLGEAVGVQVLAAGGAELVDGHVHRHDVAVAHVQLHAGLGVQQRLLQHLRAHDGGGHREGGVGPLEALLHLGTEGAVAADDVQKLLHHLVPLVLQQLVAAGGGAEAALEAGQLHAGGIDGFTGHGSPQSFLGRYLSSISGLMRFNSERGSMLNSSQPRFSVCSMVRFSSKPWLT